MLTTTISSRAQSRPSVSPNVSWWEIVCVGYMSAGYTWACQFQFVCLVFVCVVYPQSLRIFKNKVFLENAVLLSN